MNLQTTLLLWLFCAVIGAAITASKGRNWSEGALWGGLLGIIGVIVTLCLRNPNRPIGPLPDAGWYPDPKKDADQRFWDGHAWTNRLQNH